jgi:hypothetical protein
VLEHFQYKTWLNTKAKLQTPKVCTRFQSSENQAQIEDNVEMDLKKSCGLI